MRCTRLSSAHLRMLIAVLGAGASGTSLTACIHLPPAVAAEMQPAVPPAANHYRKAPDTARAPEQDAKRP